MRHPGAGAAKEEAAELREPFDEAALRQAIASFTPAWDALFPAERARLVRLVLARVVVDGRSGEVWIHAALGGGPVK